MGRGVGKAQWAQHPHEHGRAPVCPSTRGRAWIRVRWPPTHKAKQQMCHSAGEPLCFQGKVHRVWLRPALHTPPSCGGHVLRLVPHRPSPFSPPTIQARPVPLTDPYPYPYPYPTPGCCQPVTSTLFSNCGPSVAVVVQTSHCLPVPLVANSTHSPPFAWSSPLCPPCLQTKKASSFFFKNPGIQTKVLRDATRSIVACSQVESVTRWQHFSCFPVAT